MVTQIIFAKFKVLEDFERDYNIRHIIKNILVYATRENEVEYERSVGNSFVKYKFVGGNLVILDYYKIKNEK